MRNWQSTAVEPASQSTTGDKNTLRIGGKKKKNEVKEKEGIPYTTKLKMVKTIESYICMCGDTPHLVPLIFLCSTFLKLPTRKSSFTYARDRIKKKKEKKEVQPRIQEWSSSYPFLLLTLFSAPTITTCCLLFFLAIQCFPGRVFSDLM